jgi:hypothetical protein
MAIWDLPATEDCINSKTSPLPGKSPGSLAIPGARVTFNLSLNHRETTV